MNEFVIFTDSACDLGPSVLKEWGTPYVSLTFRFNDEDKDYGNNDMSIDEFYTRMRDGGVAKTAAANPDTFTDAFEPVLAEGKDVLCLGFSSGLSTTVGSAAMAANDLKEKYPDRKIIVIDTLCASAGQALIVKLAVDKKNSGCSIDEVAEYIESIKLSLCHWFTVDDLVYLKRGGRVSSAVAFVGGMLNIKPVLHVDNEGHLISKAKVRGRKASITALAAKYGELGLNDGSPIFISHGDCLTDAQMLADMLMTKYNAKVELITHIGPVIGAHAGPGTIALFFLGKER